MDKKGKIFFYALVTFVGLYFFLNTFGAYTLLRQEDVQIFLPVWSVLSEKMLSPGGCCEIIGKFLVQYYTSPLWTCILLSSLITSIGVFVYLLFERYASRHCNFLLSLFPVMVLAKAHCSPFFVVDGTIGMFFVLLFLYIYSRINHILYIWLSTLLVYGLCGQLVILYGLLLFFYVLLTGSSQWPHSLCSTILALGFTYFSIRWTICVPLTDGIYSLSYQETQLQPDSYLYYVTIRFCFLLLVLFVIAFLLNKIPTRLKVLLVGINIIIALVLGVFTYLQLPDKEEIKNNEMEELYYLAKQRDWESILQKYETKQPTNYVQLNYISLALAYQGTLGDKLFHYNPRGPQSLLLNWDRRYHTSVLLSDIHWAVGDISLSESYAMEGLTLAKRGGSARMMQRIVQISLLRQEWGLARKYLAILHQLPVHRSWADKYMNYLNEPNKIKQNLKLGNYTLPKQSNKLFSLLTMDEIWSEHLKQEQPNPIAINYVGCSYLLSKKIDKFASFLDLTSKYHQTHLPKHFQEALLILATNQPNLLEKYPVDNNTLQSFRQFQEDISKVPRNEQGLMQLQRRFGNTYWFYYYCKN